MEWRKTNGLIEYPEAVDWMERRIGLIAQGQAEECIWLLEHPPLYTGGTSAKEGDVLESRFPIYDSGRGGQYTYHGPGQRVAYIMLNLKERYAPKVPDVRHFVHTLEQWIIDSLAEIGITGERREGRIGIWIVTGQGECKIAALGIRISRGISYHGIAINVHPDVSHFTGIVPCGLKHYGVTSCHQLGVRINLLEMDTVLQRNCPFETV